MNTKLLRQAKRMILKRPRQFDMESFYSRVLYGQFEGQIPSHCGTAACIAGWIVHIHNKKEKLSDWGGVGCSSFDTHDLAERFIEISQYEAYRLFYLSHWPSAYRSRYERARTTTTRAKAAAARIEHFIKTKGAE